MKKWKDFSYFLILCFCRQNFVLEKEIKSFFTQVACWKNFLLKKYFLKNIYENSSTKIFSQYSKKRELTSSIIKIFLFYLRKHLCLHPQKLYGRNNIFEKSDPKTSILSKSGARRQIILKWIYQGLSTIHVFERIVWWVSAAVSALFGYVQ